MAIQEEIRIIREKIKKLQDELEILLECEQEEGDPHS